MHGSQWLATWLRRWLAKAVSGNARFFHLMVGNALQRTPPLGIIRDFVTDQNGKIDLKNSGVALFVDAARILALGEGVTNSGTTRRFRYAAASRGIPETEVDAWIDAFHFIQSIRLAHQHEQSLARTPPDNLIKPSDLNKLDHRIFLESLRQARNLQKRISDIYGIKGAAM
ncbi:MAG: putative nucleotidyltransferase substrate binding domain-containing protein [Alphaproteobacteria bacterium]